MTLYLYAIVDAPPAGPLGKGIAGRPLTVVRVGKAWVVVEEAPSNMGLRPKPRSVPYRGSAPGPRLGLEDSTLAPAKTRPRLSAKGKAGLSRVDEGGPSIASIVAHDRVIRRIVRASSGEGELAVLPLRFASTVTNRAAITKLLAPRSKEIAGALDRVRGAVQFTLRVTGKPARPPKLPRTVGPGTRWLAARVHAQRVPEIDPLSDATRPFVRETRTERHAGSPLLASVYHLVPRADVRRWRAAVRRSLGELDVRVTMTGPWPPYAFTELG